MDKTPSVAKAQRIIRGAIVRAKARTWSFYIFSSGGSLNQLRRAEFERKGIEDHS